MFITLFQLIKAKGGDLIAVGGGAVPCFWMWLQDGRLIIAYFGFANGAIVIDDVAEAYQRLVAGEKIFMHRYGHNLTRLKEMISNGLE